MTFLLNDELALSILDPVTANLDFRQRAPGIFRRLKFQSDQIRLSANVGRSFCACSKFQRKLVNLSDFFYQIKGPSIPTPEARRWVFVHGLMGFSSNWMKIISQLSPTELCLTYDQRGHGRSIKPQQGYAPEDYAQDLKMITDQLGWDRFILVGHSMGGRNALVFANLFPEKVEKLIIEDIGPEAAESAHVYYENLLNAVPTPFPNREAAKHFFEIEFPQKVQTRENVKMMAQFFYANIFETESGQYDWRFSKFGIIESVKAGRLKDYWHLIENLRMPTLILRGEQSQELSAESFQKMLTLNSLISGVQISNAGHWIHVDQPQQFTDVLKDFVGLGTRNPTS